MDAARGASGHPTVNALTEHEDWLQFWPDVEPLAAGVLAAHAGTAMDPLAAHAPQLAGWSEALPPGMLQQQAHSMVQQHLGMGGGSSAGDPYTGGGGLPLLPALDQHIKVCACWRALASCTRVSQHPQDLRLFFC
jgi:hypothetical protein